VDEMGTAACLCFGHFYYPYDHMNKIKGGTQVEAVEAVSLMA
jgi:hypothetical protein